MAELTGQTSSKLTISNFQAGDAGDYYVEITNSEGTTTSDTVTVQLATVPVISVQPSSQNVLLGSPLSLSVTASGIPDPSYQWRKDGQDVEGATSSIFTITATSKEDAADYDCVVSNIAGNVTSSAATVIIEYLPEILSGPSPSSQGLDVGSGTVYSVTVDAVPTATYQWKKDNVDIPGATSSSLILSNIQTGDAGSYTCAVTNTIGTVVSSPAVLAVIADAPVFTQQPLSDTASISDNVTFECIAEGAEPMTYQWKKAGVPIGGESGSATSGNPIQLTLTNVQVGDQGAYTCEVSNAAGTVESAVAVLTIGTAAPTILVQPATSVSGSSGGSIQLVIEAEGEPDVTFTWKETGTPVTIGGDFAQVDDFVLGHQRSTLTISNLDPADAGSYTCTVTNAAGSIDSNVAAVFVDSLPTITVQPTNQSIDAYDNAQFSLSATGTPLPTYQWYEETGNVTVDFDNVLDQVTFTGPQIDDGDIFVFTAGHPGEFSAATQYFVINNSYGGGDNVFQLSASRGGPAVDFTTSPTGVTVHLDEQLAGETLNVLNFASVDPSEDGSSFFCQVINAAGEVKSDVVTLTVVSLPYITNHPLTQTVDAGNTLNLSVVATGSAPLTYLWEYSVDGISGWANVSGLAGVSGDTTPNVSFTNITQAGHQYFYRCTVSNAGGAAVSNNAEVTVNESAATLTGLISDQFVGQGNTLDVTAAFSGEPYPSVTWEYDSTGGGVWVTLNDSDPSPSTSGVVTITTTSNSSRLEISNLQDGDEFTYRVSITNTGGSDSDTFAVTTLTAAPSVNTQPTNQSAGSPPVIFFSDGTPTEGETLNYQWEVDTGGGFNPVSGGDYTGGSSTTLTVANPGAKIGYLYRNVISNDFGSVNSNSATLNA